MIINALCNYYDILINDPDYGLPPIGYSRVAVSFALNISPHGKLLDIMDLREKDERGKKYIANEYAIVPEQGGRSGTTPKPYLLCDNSGYVIGISKDKKDAACKKFEAFRELHYSKLGGFDNKYSLALLNFLNKWNPVEAERNELIKEYQKELMSGGYIVFRVDGLLGYVHNQESIKALWESIPRISDESITGQCLVSGETTNIQHKHNKIKGILGLSADSALISVNSQASNAYDSYGKENAYNSPVGIEAAFKYTSMLNYLLSQKDTRIIIGDATTVFWAQSPEKTYAELAGLILSGTRKSVENVERDAHNEKLIRDILQCVKEGRKISDVTDEIDDSTKFYILGLSPNAGRISVRFFHINTFGSFIKNISIHYEDMKLEDGQKQIPVWQILNETVPSTSKEKKVSPLLGGAVIRSIISGAPYPFALYSAILSRIKHEQDDKEKRIISINSTRVSIIKAYLRRLSRIQKNKEYEEVLDVSINEESKNPAYLLGRLFAVLEKAQETANGELNTTIKDRYFSTASAAPCTVFPTLIRLSQHHLAKAEKSKWLEIKMGELIDRLNGFPSHLNIEEQGVFILGYYQQRQSFFKKKEEKTVNINK